MKHLLITAFAFATLAACGEVADVNNGRGDLSLDVEAAEANLGEAPPSATAQGGNHHDDDDDDDDDDDGCPDHKELICHVRGNGSTKTLCVGDPAVEAHLNHGDTLGPCDDDDDDDDDCDDGDSGDAASGDGDGDGDVGDGCPAEYAARTPLAVIADLRAALGAQDWFLVGCHYAVDAFVIDDQGTLLGRTEIVSAMQSLANLFSGAQAQVNDEDTFQDVVRTLYTLDAGWIVIPDGVHTYVIDGGVITKQTTHGLIEFTGPPPDSL